MCTIELYVINPQSPPAPRKVRATTMNATEGCLAPDPATSVVVTLVLQALIPRACLFYPYNEPEPASAHESGKRSLDYL